MSYKDTINLLETPFPMKGDLAKREPEMLNAWKTQKRYEKLRDICKSRKKFVLHDGPPYANGKLHIGHGLNKILKDIIVRFKTLSGFNADFVPGWDCHGLPIEINVEKKFGKNLEANEFRNKCRQYASSQIEIQKSGFERLGVWGSWDNPYTTMNFASEANIVRALGEIYKNGYLHSGLKPVYWCVDCASALAEAEVEYHDKESLAIDVAFEVTDLSQISHIFDIDDTLTNVYAVIWTTTPWTLPANEAICVGNDIDYSLVHDIKHGRYLIIASKLVGESMNRYKTDTSEYKVVANTTGKNLEHLKCRHPFYDKVVPIVLGLHATDDAGTGLVHTAPAHGVEDYKVALLYDLAVNNPVNKAGCYFDEIEFVGGTHVFKVNDIILSLLSNALLASSKISHSYPCCWRHKSKLIFRSTKQWFIKLDHLVSQGKSSLRDKALEELQDIKFFPSWGYSRFSSMINNRPDWCVSRQRKWGTPMTFFLHEQTGELHPDSYSLLQKIALLIEQNGINAWHDLRVEDFLSPSDCKNYSKLTDTLDVWFDSGVSHQFVLNQTPSLQYPADVYLEGSDQHRGWFQSSLLTGCAIFGNAPYKQIITHGFLVDGNGYKMSKSLGNTADLVDNINQYGADIIRLWVASSDYSSDVAYSGEVMKRTQDTYRRIRNTIKFMLSNLSDFNFESNMVAIGDMLEIDKYALLLTNQLKHTIISDFYANYKFHQVVQELVTFCIDTLGGFYLDILKDRLYVTGANSHARRSAQSALYYITKTLLLLLSPILCFTSDEAWGYIANDHTDSTMYHTYESLSMDDMDELATVEDFWQHIYSIREIVLKELEFKRQEGLIGSSAEAELDIYVADDIYKLLEKVAKELKYIYMVSKVVLHKSSETKIVVNVSTNSKCSRCYRYENSANGTLCLRCANVIDGNEECRVFA